MKKATKKTGKEIFIWQKKLIYYFSFLKNKTKWDIYFSVYVSMILNVNRNQKRMNYEQAEIFDNWKKKNIREKTTTEEVIT